LRRKYCSIIGVCFIFGAFFSVIGNSELMVFGV
jgi:hypothetical protein